MTETTRIAVDCQGYDPDAVRAGIEQALSTLFIYSRSVLAVRCIIGMPVEVHRTKGGVDVTVRWIQDHEDVQKLMTLLKHPKTFLLNLHGTKDQGTLSIRALSLSFTPRAIGSRRDIGSLPKP